MTPRSLLARLALAATAVVLVPIGAVAAAPPQCAGVDATIVGTPGDDELDGTPGADVFFADLGNDTINGA
ncbi:MAG: hypothetical protein ACR2QE_17190, partial [Acidimicrobiales bacterium]